MKYYTIFSEDERHYGMKYVTGLNTDIKPFNPSGDCISGGIYFSREDILAFLSHGLWLRDVTLPDGEPVYENPDSPRKWKAHRVILGKRRKITTKVIRELIAAGADVHANDDAALRWAAGRGHEEIVKLLIAAGADVHADDDVALRRAADKGHEEVVKTLLAAGADVHANDDAALRWAASNGYEDVVKILIAAGADVHANDDAALRLAAGIGHEEIAKLLIAAGANRTS